MRMLKNRLLWGILGVTAGAWVVQNMRERKEEQRISVRRGGNMWRPMGSVSKPTVLDMAARAGRAMMDTTMRAVRSMSRT